jgi:hypothetical protein
MSLLALMSDPSRTKSIGAVFDSCAVLSTGIINVTFAQEALVDLGNGGGADMLQVNHADGFEVQLANGTWLAIDITAHQGSQVQLGPLLHAEAGVLLGLRYAWRDHACCPKFYSADPIFSNWIVKDRDHPQMNGVCPPKNCSLYTKGSGLPATPFTVSLGPKDSSGAQLCREFVTKAL